MTRQEQLKEIGNMHLSEYTSKFIIPVPHRFYENDKSIFGSIAKSNWNIVNKPDEIKDDEGKTVFKEVRRMGAFNIKAYIYNNMIPKFDNSNKESFLHDSRTLVLNQKFKNQKMKLTGLNKKEYYFSLTDIELWIFEENISFFVLNIEFDDPSNRTINELNEFNKIFRSFKFLDKENELKPIIKLKPSTQFKPIIKLIKLEESKMIMGEKSFFLEYLLELTEIQTVENMTDRGETMVMKSLLNIDACDCTEQYKNKKINDLYSIYNSSTNAKLLLGMQTEDTDYVDGTTIEEPNEKCMSFESVREMSILNEIPYYLATCTSFAPDKGWASNDEYIYQLVNEGGFNVWKYSSGITIHDSSAFIGLANDGGPIVNNVNGSFYFIYMLNLYINFQTKYIAHSLIDNNFESRDINYWYKKLQKLKNQFVADDIGIKFQENELNKSMSSALKTKDLLSEVSSNLVETKTITASNRGIYITLAVFIFLSFVVEPLKNIFSSQELYIKILALAAVSVAGVIAYMMRIKIIKKLKL